VSTRLSLRERKSDFACRVTPVSLP